MNVSLHHAGTGRLHILQICNRSCTTVFTDAKQEVRVSGHSVYTKAVAVDSALQQHVLNERSMISFSSRRGMSNMVIPRQLVDPPTGLQTAARSHPLRGC